MPSNETDMSEVEKYEAQRPTSPLRRQKQAPPANRFGLPCGDVVHAIFKVKCTEIAVVYSRTGKGWYLARDVGGKLGRIPGYRLQPYDTQVGACFALLEREEGAPRARIVGVLFGNPHRRRKRRKRR